MTSESGCWAQTIYWPFLHASTFGRGTSLNPVIKSPVYSSKDFDDVPLVDAAAVLADDGSLTIFALNRSINNHLDLSLDLRSFGAAVMKEHIVLHHDDIKAINTESTPDNVVPSPQPVSKCEMGKISVTLPALSWNVLRFS
jgi:alpha-N-arabinofuranosidase